MKKSWRRKTKVEICYSICYLRLVFFNGQSFLVDEKLVKVEDEGIDLEILL